MRGGRHLSRFDKGNVLAAKLDSGAGPCFVKHQQNAFFRSRLDAHLREHGVGRLYVCGLDLTACVYKTALGAKKLGYEVTVLSDNVTTLRKSWFDSFLNKFSSAGISVPRSLP